jgi:diguanylate cyclase (GGDEF)-like protein
MLEKDADTDPLTGLMNRRAVEALVDEYVSVKQDSGVLLMIDIDNFKQVNDNFGHEVGDRLLKLLADTLKPYTRAYDVLGRLGGDEFIIFYQGFQNMESLVERCRNINAKTEYVLNDMLGNAATIPLSISIGVARAPEDGEDFNTLYMNADKALYHVKQNGKRGYYFYEGGCNSIHSISEDDHAIDILQVRMMIEEHSKLPGAYSVSYEDFKKIYRFLKRRAERTETDAQFVLFTLHDDDRRSGKILQENSTDKYAEQNAVEKKDILREFGTIAEKTLRRGDVAAQYGQSQYMMLLTGTNQSNGLIAVNRILDNWKNDNIGSEFHMEYEMQDLAV